MCFSASVSFGASAVIGIIGVVTLKKAKSPSQFAFASIPLIFAIQQFVEGVLWLAMQQPDFIVKQQIATYTFIVIAQVIWPTLVPVSVMLLEKEKKRKKILSFLVAIGIFSSIFGIYHIMYYDVVAQNDCHHIKYVFNISWMLLPLINLFYFLTTIVSLFVSSIKRMILFGSLVLASLIISQLFFELVRISVWCFFAAIISGIILLIISELNSVPKTENAS